MIREHFDTLEQSERNFAQIIQLKKQERDKIFAAWEKEIPEARASIYFNGDSSNFAISIDLDDKKFSSKAVALLVRLYGEGKKSFDASCGDFYWLFNRDAYSYVFLNKVSAGNCKITKKEVLVTRYEADCGSEGVQDEQ